MHLFTVASIHVRSTNGQHNFNCVDRALFSCLFGLTTTIVVAWSGLSIIGPGPLGPTALNHLSDWRINKNMYTSSFPGIELSRLQEGKKSALSLGHQWLPIEHAKLEDSLTPPKFSNLCMFLFQLAAFPWVNIFIMRVHKVVCWLYWKVNMHNMVSIYYTVDKFLVCPFCSLLMLALSSGPFLLHVGVQHWKAGNGPGGKALHCDMHTSIIIEIPAVQLV